MGNINTSIEHLVGIYQSVANAIRTKAGTSATIKPDDFAQQILSIPAGGGSSEESVEYSVAILKKAAATNTYPTASFESGVWYFYDSEQGAFMQRDASLKTIDITNLGDSLFFRIDEREDCDDVAIAISDRSVLVNAYINGGALEVLDDSMSVIRLKTTSKLSSLSDITLKLDMLSFSADETYDDLLISNSDEANMWTTAILSNGAALSYGDIAKDADTNYVLDRVLGVEDPEEELRTFAALENYGYDGSGCLSWSRNEKASSYAICMKANGDEIFLDRLEDAGEESFSYDILSGGNFELSDWTTKDLIYADVKCEGDRFSDGDNLLKISAPVSAENGGLQFNDDYSAVSYVPSGETQKFNIYDAAGKFIDRIETTENPTPLVAFGDDGYSATMTNVESGKLTDADIAGNSIDLCSFTYAVESVDGLNGFVKQSNSSSWYSCRPMRYAGEFAYAKITFSSRRAATVRLVMQEYSSSTTQNFGIVSNLNTYLDKSSAKDDSGFIARLNDNVAYTLAAYNPGAPFAFWIDIPEGESFITLKYVVAAIDSSSSITDRLLFRIEEERHCWYIAADSCCATDYCKDTIDTGKDRSFVYQNKIYTASRNSYYLYSFDPETGDTSKTATTQNYYVVSAGLLSEDSGLYYCFCADNYLRIVNIKTNEIIAAYSASRVQCGDSSSFAKYQIGCCAVDGKIYFTNSYLYNYMYIFDVATATATRVYLPYCGYKHMLPIHGKIYFVGAIYTDYSYYNDYFYMFMLTYDPKTNQWEYGYESGLPCRAQTRYAAVCAVANRYIALVGDDSSARKVFIYDTVSKTCRLCDGELGADYGKLEPTTGGTYYRYGMNAVSIDNVVYTMLGYIRTVSKTGSGHGGIFKTTICNYKDLKQ